MRRKKKTLLKKIETIFFVSIIVLGGCLLTVQYLHTHTDSLDRFQPYMKYHGVFTDPLVNEVEGMIFLKGILE